MTKKILLVLLFALAISAMMTVPAMAATAPEYYDGVNEVLVSGKEYFFANGTPITIEKLEGDETGTTGALVKWEGGSVEVGPNVNIFGGMHDDDTEVTSSIIMNGGTVNNIFGGGLHKSNTTSAEVTFNDGTANYVSGGGASSFTNACGCDNASWYAGDAKNSPCQTGTAYVTVNGGTINSCVFGGGEGISNTESAEVIINDGDLSEAWVTAAGANGNTTTSALIVAGGEINVVQSVNRGTAKDATIVVAGGKINDLYVGGEEALDVNAIVSGSLQIGVAGTAQVTNMSLGTNGGVELVISDDEGSILTSESIIVVEGTVTTNNIPTEDLIVAHHVIIDDELYLVQSGDTVENIAGGVYTYDEIITPKEGYKFVGFVTDDGEAWVVSAKIESDLVLETVFEEEPKDDGQTDVKDEEDEEDDDDDEEDKGELDETSPTGVETIVLPVLATIAVISLASLVVIKKRK